MFERFTDEARRTIVLGQEEARLLRHDVIGTEHLLLGLLNTDSTAADELTAAGATPEGCRQQVAGLRKARWRGPAGHIPFTARAKRALEVAAHSGAERIGPSELLVAVLAQRDGNAVAALSASGVDVDALAARANGPQPPPVE